MATIEKRIECPPCNGTGVYVGMAERGGAAVVCRQCKGSGEYLYQFQYEEFTGRKKSTGVKRVYRQSYGFVIGTSKINFGDKIVDMASEGVSYDEFCAGKMPEHTKSIACPMLADQGSCHKIEGFTDECMKINDGWIGNITSCKGQREKSSCWKRFEASRKAI